MANPRDSRLCHGMVPTGEAASNGIHGSPSGPARRAGPDGFHDAERPVTSPLRFVGSDPAGTTDPLDEPITAAPRALSDREVAARLRTAVGALPVSRVAERVNMNSETVRRYLTGASRIPATAVARLAVEFEVDPAELLVEHPPAIAPARIEDPSVAVSLDRLRGLRDRLAGMRETLAWLESELQSAARSVTELAETKPAV